MIYSELERTITRHLVAGITLSVIIFSVIALGKYKNSLLDATSRSELIRINALKMKENTIHMDSVIKRMNSLLPHDYYSKSHRELLLLALDNIKMTIKGSVITVTNFDEKADEITLPVNISIPVDDYVSLVNNIGYLQSMRFPHFVIKNVVMERAADSGTIICRIDGLLKMPGKEIGRL